NAGSGQTHRRRPRAGRRVLPKRAAAPALVGRQELHGARFDGDADTARRIAPRGPGPAQAPRVRQADRGRAAVSLKGTLAEFPLDALLRLLADTKKTGELNLRGPSSEGALGIDQG